MTDLGVPAAAIPTAGVEPETALAATLQSSATTAVLVGSGMSSAAGILTGWQITLDLIARVAAAEGVPAEELGDHPDLWWQRTRGSEPRYDTILTALAPTDANRQHLLRRYFEANDNRVAPQPTAAHRVLARLVRRGSVPVIITTNFDRLIERALAEEGIAAQVVNEPDAVQGMTPLVHSDVTVIKLHGDYAGGRLRNVPPELADYPPEWTGLLQRVFDEYGLLVVGWSGDYDVALARAVTTTVGRRYAWYWATYRGDISEDGQRLVNGRGAHVINSHGADALFADVEARVQGLDRVAARRKTARKATYLQSPTSRPDGWAAMPLVVARAVVALGPATESTTAQLNTEVREALIAALEGSSLSTAIRVLASHGHPAHADAQRQPGSPAGQPALFGAWEVPPDSYQSTVQAVYRLGTDATTGVTALVTVRTPQPQVGGEITLIADVGISLTEGVPLRTLATVLRASLGSLDTDVVAALEAILPEAADVTRWEAHWAAPSNYDNTNRPVPEANGVDFTPFGAPTRVSIPYGGWAEHPTGPATDESVTNFLMRAFESVALDNGYLHPEKARLQIRDTW